MQLEPVQIGDETHRRTNRAMFKRELQTLLNRFSMENDSDTEDFVLADYLMECLTALEKALAERRRLSGGSRR
jgi:hypothetical protein